MNPRIAVITVSDRSSKGEREDLSGPEAVRLLAEGGCDASLADVVPDDIERIRDAVRAAARDGADVVLTTGGTGLGPRDVTPEAMDGLIAREVPGLADAIRAQGTSHGIVTSALSRGRVGICEVPVPGEASGGGVPSRDEGDSGGSVPAVRHVLVVNAPGSPGGVRDAVAVLLPVVRHAVDQMAGGDH